jgi:hypothetical protein
MPPRHQGYTLGEVGGDHVPNCATDTDICPNRARFALIVSKTHLFVAAERELVLDICGIFEHKFTFGVKAGGRLAS